MRHGADQVVDLVGRVVPIDPIVVRRAFPHRGRIRVSLRPPRCRAGLQQRKIATKHRQIRFGDPLRTVLMVSLGPFFDPLLVNDVAGVYRCIHLEERHARADPRRWRWPKRSVKSRGTPTAASRGRRTTRASTARTHPAAPDTANSPRSGDRPVTTTDHLTSGPATGMLCFEELGARCGRDGSDQIEEWRFCRVLAKRRP